MTCVLMRSREHPGFKLTTFVLVEGIGTEHPRTYLRRRYYFPSGNYLTDADREIDSANLETEIERDLR